MSEMFLWREDEIAEQNRASSKHRYDAAHQCWNSRCEIKHIDLCAGQTQAKMRECMSKKNGEVWFHSLYIPLVYEH